MTTAADDRAVEEAFEASLAGQPVREGAAGLAAFTSAVRGTATRPGRPNAALAELLSTGLLTDQSSPSTRTAPAAGSLPSRRTGSRTRRRFTVIVPALIAKFLAAGAVAQAATGAGVVVVVVTGAGTAGVLPGDAQQAFTDVTGINATVDRPVQEIADTDGEDVKQGEESVDPAVPAASSEQVEGQTEVQLADAADADDWAEAAKAITTQQQFKDWLAEGKENGWVNGQAVSTAVHARNEARDKAREAERAAQREAEETETPEAPEAEDQEEAAGEDASEVESSDDEGAGDRKGNGKGRGAKN